MARLRRRTRTATGDDGFSVMEVAVAVGLIFTVVVMLMYSGVVALVDVAHSRQRQGATGLANEALEQVRALPFATLALGMVTADLNTAADPNLTRSGSAAPYTFTYRGETIPHGSHAAGTPLFPHQRTVTVENTRYTVSVYVTRYRNSLTNNTLRATAEVSWANPLRQGVVPKVEAQTVLHPGGGCQSTALHPYSGPCLAFFESIAQSQPGSVAISGWFLDRDPDGSTRQVLVDLKLLLPTQRATFKSEQVSHLQQVVEASGVTLAVDGGAAQSSGRAAISTGADNDPSTTRGEFETITASHPALPLHGGVSNTVRVAPSTLGSASASSAAAARASSSPCAIGGISEDDGEPCTRGEVAQSSTMEASLYVSQPASLGVIDLASVSPGESAPAASQFGFADRNRPSGPGCAGTVDGCSRARATRSLGELRLGGVPASAEPSGWAGYLLRVRDLDDAVEAWSGRGVAGPSTSRTGTLEWWNGVGYTAVDLASASSAGTITSTLSSTAADGVRVDVNAVISVDAPSTSTSAACAAPCDLAEASAASGSPMTGEISYRVSVGADTITELLIKVDLGAASATSTYKAAT